MIKHLLITLDIYSKTLPINVKTVAEQGDTLFYQAKDTGLNIQNLAYRDHYLKIWSLIIFTLYNNSKLW